MANKVKKDQWSFISQDNEKYAKRSKGYLALLRYRLRKAEKKVCGVNGCYEKAEGFMCQKHRLAHAEYQRARYKKKKEVASC